MEKIDEKELKKTEGKEEQEKTIKEENLPHKNFSKEDFAQFLTKFLDRIKEKDKLNYSLLQTISWELKEPDKIELIFETEVMIQEFNSIKPEFIKFAKEQLDNHYLEVEAVISESKTDKKYIKTREDIFEDLVKVNPEISHLHKVFRLDIENEPK